MLVLLDDMAEAAVAAVAPRVGAALVVERCGGGGVFWGFLDRFFVVFFSLVSGC